MTLKKIDHTFAYDQLSYDAKPNEQPYIKLSFFFSKLPDVSYEHFHRHWQSIHSDLTIGTKAFKSNKIQRYVQVKTFISEYAVSESHGLHISVAFLPRDEEDGYGLRYGFQVCLATSIVLTSAPGLDLLDYDGCSEIYVKNFEDWDNFSKVKRGRLRPRTFHS
jgi:hypothetical protein